MALAVALVVVEIVARPLLLLQKQRPPEPSKSPGPPKISRLELNGWSVLLLRGLILMLFVCMTLIVRMFVCFFCMTPHNPKPDASA